MSDFPQGLFGTQLFQRIWDSILKKQDSINKQLEESEKRLFRQMEEDRRLTKLSEEKFFRQLEDKNRQLEVIDLRINKQLKENRIKENEPDYNEGTTGKKSRRSKNKKHELPDGSFEISIIVKPRQDDIENQITKLMTLIYESGFDIIDHSENKIEITSLRKEN